MTRCRFLNETSGVVIDWAGTRSDVQMDRCEFGDVADMVMDNAAAGGRDCGITIVWNYFHGSHDDNSGPSGYGAYIWYNGHNVAQNNGARWFACSASTVVSGQATISSRRKATGLSS
jgi:hypothetical protein